MLTCREITELVTDYLEGRLTLWRRLLFRMHIGMCRHCMAYLRQMRLTIRMLGESPGLAGAVAPPQIPDELLQRFRQWKRQPLP